MCKSLKTTWRFYYISKFWNKLDEGCNRIIRLFKVPGDAEAVTILPLTPIRDVKEIDTYADRLRMAMDDPLICNIAVTGRFGAGKSSFLKTYFNHAKVLWISLAPFIDLIPGDIKDKARLKDRESLGRKLENSILQQMFYTAKASELPFSRFSRIKKNTILSYITTLFLTLLTLGLVVSIYQPQRIWSHICKVYNLNSDAWCVYSLFALSIPIVFFVKIGCDVIRRSYMAGRVNAGCAEIEVGQKNGELVFNHVIEEVIYHFQNVNYEAVVFEDLDRFSDTLIFAKLKEVNQLINASRDVAWHKKPIKFIYAVRDNVLKDVDRVKFFDYILPILPVMSVANSAEVFTTCLKCVLKEKELKSEFGSLIRTVAQYIFDRRLIHNICNEFVVMKERLGDSIPAANLLGVVVYKNILPDDFEDIQEGHGVLFGLIEKSRQIISNILKEKESQIKELREEEEKVDVGDSRWFDIVTDRQHREEELRLIKAMALADVIKDGKITIKDIYKFMGIRAGNRYDACGSRGWYQKNQANLLFALTGGGYLTEEYKHYIVSYDDVIIPREDHEFLLSCLGSDDIKEDYQINKTDDFVNELSMASIEHKKLQNFSLLRWFLLEETCPLDKKIAILSTVLTKDSLDVGFFDRMFSFYKDEEDLWSAFYREVRSFGVDYLKKLEDCDSIVHDRKLKQIGLYLKANPAYPDIKLRPHTLRFLSKHTKIGELFRAMSIDPNDAMVLMCGNKIQFEVIDFDEKDGQEYLDKVIESASYKLTESVVFSILKHKSDIDFKVWDRSRGTMILGCRIDSLKDRVENDFVEFVTNVYLKAPEKQYEDQRFICWILNREYNDNQILKNLLSKQANKLEDVTGIVKNKLKMAIEQDCIRPTWKNLVHCYNSLEDGDKVSVLKYIEDFEENVVIDANDRYCDGSSELVEMILRSSNVSDSFCVKLCERLCTNSDETPPKFEAAKEWSIERLIGLAKLRLITFTKEVYERVSREQKGLIELLAQDIEGYFAIIDQLEYNSDIASEFMRSNCISYQDKMRFLEHYKNNVVNDDALKKFLGPMISSRNYRDFPFDFVCKCFGYLCSAAVKCVILTENDFDKNNMLVGLGIVGGPFAELQNKDCDVVLPKSDIVCKLADKLKSMGIIKSYSVEDYTIEVRTESSFPF